ncbi:hypothetical protein T484DRAFT_1810815 [Baffinella frigidus]|nr:hypothetical protein T484DRAFT_1810815 [Cryptophyta sp. CCMP2293]
MGEPLANYREVMLSLRTLTHRSLFAIADREVALSLRTLTHRSLFAIADR